MPILSEAPAIVVEDVRKRFRVVTIPKHATLKETIVGLTFLKRMRPPERYIQAVNGVSFSVRGGETLGIIGKNGSGKSTLMRLLGGIYKPDSGAIRIAGATAPLLSLGVGFHPDMTGRENIRLNGLVLGLSPAQIQGRYREIVAFSELEDFIDLPVRTYSSGMYMRLAFSIAISIDPDVLLLDEILAVGDEAFAEKCYRRMRAFKDRGKTIVLVSHGGATIRQWCETAVWLDQGRIRMHGPAGEVVAAYRALAEEAALVS